MTERTLTPGPLTAATDDIRDHGYAIVQTRIERVPARYRNSHCAEPSLHCGRDEDSVVLDELDRISALSVVQDREGGADTFAVGVRWAVRMVREAIERGAPADPDAEQHIARLAAVPSTY